MKITKAKIILAIFVLVAVVGGYFFINKFWMLGKDSKVQTVKAAGYFPFYIGGEVVYNYPCSVTDVSGSCAGICPLCTGTVGNGVCAGYNEILIAPYFTTAQPFICVPKVQPIFGGMPAFGMWIVSFGITNFINQVWVTQ